MSNVQTVLDDIARQLSSVEPLIANHPFIDQVEAGAVSRENLQVFAAEQYRIITSDLRSVACLIARADTDVTRDFFSFVLTGEQIALENLEPLSAGLGTSIKKLASTTPLAEAQAYRNYMAWLAMQGPMAGVAAAYLVNFPAWGACCGRLAEALQTSYGLSEKQVQFLVGFATPSDQFEEKAHAVIAEGLDAGISTEEIRDVAALLQHYELMFWNAMPDGQ